MDTTADYTIVTEKGGEQVSRGQLERFHQRYLWAGGFCKDRDVLEMACGTGPGLGYLKACSRSLVAGDLSSDVLAVARSHYRERVELLQFDAAHTPFASESFDVVMLFEAIYYLPDAQAFAREAHRLLRPGGVLLLATANKDLPDFNPSPFSTSYFNPPELGELLAGTGFRSRFLGGSPVGTGLVADVLRMAKRAAVALRLIPRTMKGKRLLKRIVFGKLTRMPLELSGEGIEYAAPREIAPHLPDARHQVLYCIAEKTR